ncbi:MAG: hypothetical protein A2600_05215 [Candidatus Lambdaproteobacteria bacterium RIFOXYD1_FULL_56_27]|uniref:Phenazine biosynthesis protein PhzF n=1 Tax=Candidatus Lambdaproteobacteria bacterium RIFOXYD2_FULL_56_26 TaxID=1817773 RepID=A0A1F6GRL5_9PROT|nr:MAG: hypothetical protein A2426_08070 [Candidatus Lambdaproteobacteria bacterium RIFOXYC1_FULL_56_13]OGH00782.1 MAG: hypothetical protein A2557_03670 [Candidatus Lambdaproteobacteria bacterium RIFOXYD2_FULL_56_26]OGH09953.1 MAG: hypothetical protein A2600_05215 [Candidatus Lambdaproteobacteria bacterium RIFOXYD1_FULL_56_27]
MSYPFLQLNVFSTDPLAGNPVALVKLDQPMPYQRMLALASWTNLSETAFVSPSLKGDYQLRIFTPKGEIPFAGHPSLGGLYAALAWGLAPPNQGRYLQECGQGLVELRNPGLSRFGVQMPKTQVTPLSEPRQRLSALLLPPLDAPPLLVNLGPKWLVAQVQSVELLYQKTPDPSEIKALSLESGADGVTVFAWEEEGRKLHLRSYAPLAGIVEDPVCGSGNGAVAAYLLERGFLRSGSYLAFQGQALGRSGEIEVEAGPEGIWVTGQVQPVVEGSLWGL